MKVLVAIISLASAQAHRTGAMARELVWILNYFAMHPDTVIRYKQSDAIIAIHSDDSYLSNKK